jgi:hypothetical protein
LGVVVAGGGVGGSLPGVGFGLGGEPELSGDVGRGAVLGAFGLEGAGFELAMGHTADDVIFVAYFQGADGGQAHGFEFGLLRCGRSATACSGSVIRLFPGKPRLLLPAWRILRARQETLRQPTRRDAGLARDRGALMS